MTTRRLIGHACRAELLLHALLLADRLPPAAICAGAAAHLAYLRLLQQFPYVRLSSGVGLASLGLLAAAAGLWIRHFMGTLYSGAVVVWWG